ncbi:hypothetical protein CHS0354_024103 [Potamilus streckersoni]|uniref:TolC family protein n=1 Tax=Potamilus streckersoni TaxID=2493646 RepID=A0AAE0RZN3_9BIVA|nr:hypothetical protein CHS0354_024103 [Potamilus streckersoni]
MLKHRIQSSIYFTAPLTKGPSMFGLFNYALFQVLLFAFSLFGSALYGQSTLEQVQHKELTLEECIEYGLAKSLDFSKKKLATDIAGIQVIQNYFNFLPVISASADASLSSGARLQQYNSGTNIIFSQNLSDSYSASAKLSGSLNLFDGLNNISKYMSALKDNEASKYTLERAKEDIMYDITLKFFQAVMDYQLISSSKKNLEAISATVRQTEMRVKTGIRTETELLQQKAEMFNSEFLLLKAQNQYELSLLALLQTINIDTKHTYTLVTPTIDTTKEAVEPLTEISILENIALQNRNDLKSRDFIIEKFYWQEIQARSVFFPSLSLQGSYGNNATIATRTVVFGKEQDLSTQPPFLDQLRNQYNYSFGLNLSWNITNIFLGVFQTKAAAYQTESTKLDKAILIQNIQSDVAKAVLALKAAYKEMWVANKTYEATKSSYEQTDERYKMGSATWVDLQNNYRNFFKSETDLIRAKMNLALQRKVLIHVTGHLSTDQQLIPIIKSFEKK